MDVPSAKRSRTLSWVPTNGAGKGPTCDGATLHGDGELLACFRLAEDLATLVPELALRDRSHEWQCSASATAPFSEVNELSSPPRTARSLARPATLKIQRRASRFQGTSRHDGVDMEGKELSLHKNGRHPRNGPNSPDNAFTPWSEAVLRRQRAQSRDNGRRLGTTR